MKLLLPDLIAALALALTLAFSTFPVTGDGHEYLLMAGQLSRGKPPAVTIETAKAAGVFEPGLVNRDGRQEMWHFWMLPLFAAPLTALVRTCGGPPVLAFALLNAILLWTAFAALRRRGGLMWAVVLCLSPIIWWIDKPQVEVFTFVWILLGCLAIPRLAVASLCFAIAATQNPPVAGLIVLLWLTGLTTAPRRRRDWWLLAAALALVAAHPLYYAVQLGRPTPLVDTGDLRLPGLRALVTPLIDLNVGLLAAAPLPLAAVGFMLARALRRHAAPWRRLVFVLGAEALFLFAFAQAPNTNSGGTPGLSRYALWLFAPLALLVQPYEGPYSRPDSGPGPAAGPQGWLGPALTLLSVAWCLVFFNPRLPERYLTPTPLADWAWSRHPGLENPLPEIFAERLRHQDGVNLLAATGNCAKALIQDGRWPDPCSSSQLLPDECRLDGTLCYANLDAGGSYVFVPTSRRGGIHLTDLIPFARR